MGNKIVTISSPPDNVDSTQVDFILNDFEKLIWQKGYSVLHESALKCPCKSKNSGQQSNCKNCGGSGWAFINAVETRMVIHSMNLTTQFKEWSEESIGTASVTCMDREKLSFMDKITVVDGKTIFGEVLFLKQLNTNLFFYTTYDIKEIQYIALFDTVTSKYTNLFYNTDFTYTKNKIILNPVKWTSLIPIDGDLSIIVRYVHSPVFLIIDLQRNTMVSDVKILGVESPEQFPIHAVGRRLHYVLDQENYSGTRILDNSYDYKFTDLNPPISEC